MRRALENLAVRQAAVARGGSVAKELAAVVDRGFAAIERRRHREIPDLIDRSTTLIYAVASGNSELVALLEQLRTRVRWMFEVDVEHRSEGSWNDHREVLDAVLAGDEERAVALMDAHVAKDEQLYRSMSPSP